MEISAVRGFNYQPGYAWNSYEAWRFFDDAVFSSELGIGKLAFPGFNTVRLWLSYDAFRYEEERQCRNFEAALRICDQLGIMVVPVLFNRWHSAAQDNGGIYYTQMVPESCWCAKADMYNSYFERMVKPQADDKRILAWDICNEPFSYGKDKEFVSFIKPYEKAWLKKMYTLCKAAGVDQPVSFSPAGFLYDELEFCNEISDIFMIHPYYYLSDQDLTNKSYDGFVEELSKIKAICSARFGKEVLTTETCWGSLDDSMRTQIIEYSLQAHQAAGIGFIAHALCYSHVADLHNPEDGPVSEPGNLCFLNKDYSIRRGHEVFNRFC